MTHEPRYWLMKSEPSAFSIEDLEKAPGRTTCWDGVRNYQARNYMREMRVGDRVLFYHSNADPPAVAGIATVVREAYPDPTAFDPKDRHYDPKSHPARPRWDMVDIRLVRKFRPPLPLEVLRRHQGLKRMELLRRGSRLSVQPVRPEEWAAILGLAGMPARTIHGKPTPSTRPRGPVPGRSGRHRGDVPGGPGRYPGVGTSGS